MKLNLPKAKIAIWFIYLRSSSSATSPMKGQPHCPCKPASSFPPQLVAVLVQRGFPATYGVGCAAHDEEVDPLHQWCFVDHENCEVPREPYSTFLPNVTAYVSYATCGSLKNVATLKDRMEELRGRTLVGFPVEATGGLYGARYEDGEWQGPVVDFIDDVADKYKFQVNKTETLPDWVYKKAADFYATPPTKFDVCVFAASIGVVDLCIGQFGVSPEREKMTTMVRLQSEKVILVVEEGESSTKLGQAVRLVFSPFSAGAWMMIIIGFGALVLALLFFERDNAFFQGRWHKRIAAAFRILATAFSQLEVHRGAGGHDAVQAEPGKMLLIGTCFYMFLLASLYTANLASIYTTAKETNPVRNADDLIAQNYRISGEQKNLDFFNHRHPDVDPNNLVSVPGEKSRIENLNMVKDHAKVQSAVAFEEDLLALQQEDNGNCNLVPLREPVGFQATGFPANPVYGPQLEAVFAEAIAAGGYSVYRVDPESICVGHDEEDENKVSIEWQQVIGVLLVPAVFVFGGILVELYEWFH